MAPHCDKQQAAVVSVSTKPKNTTLASTNVTHKQASEVLSKTPEEHRGEQCVREEEEETMLASTGAAEQFNSKAQPVQQPATRPTTPQEHTTRDCQCSISRQQQHLGLPIEPTIKSSEHCLAPAAHLNYELISGFRPPPPPPPPPPHYYYAPPFDHLQYSMPHAAFATLANHHSYHQNCYPYTFPLNLELCYPQLFPSHHPQHSYPPKQQLLFAPNHYNQQQVAYPTTHLAPNNPHSFRNLQSPYQLYQPVPFYGPLFPALPTSHYQPPSRSHLAHDPPHTYPILPFNCYTQPINKQSSATATIETPPIENFLPHLPIQAQPAKIRQAYGMDKVWNDEFELLFSHLAPEVTWSFVEVESNPIIIDSDSILAYKGHYIIAKRQLAQDDPRDAGFCEEEEEEEEGEERGNISSPHDEEATTSTTGPDQAQDKTDLLHIESPECQLSNTDELLPVNKFKEKDDEDKESSTSSSELVDSKDSDCDSGTQTNCSSTLSSETLTNYQSGSLNNEQSISPARNGNPTTRFRMFIDSAKVRFCCNQCGHGWTSMKGRVVFWYELFELVDERYEEETNSSGTLIGYCAYKLFGQQCDVCKVENRFERPMWYPEEVSKVLNNMYNKVGQVYFGFQMPAIDKQRRAGKPKTSHNSSLCQACQNGLCTDRK